MCELYIQVLVKEYFEIITQIIVFKALDFRTLISKSSPESNLSTCNLMIMKETYIKPSNDIFFLTKIEWRFFLRLANFELNKEKRQFIIKKCQVNQNGRFQNLSKHPTARAELLITLTTK